MITHKFKRKIASTLLDKIPQSLRPKTILELGTGTGFIGKKLSDIYPESKFTLCDPAPNMIHVAKSKITNKSNFSFMCEELPQSGKFDLIITSMAIQWVADWSSWMSHVHKLLKPSAKLFIATPTTGTLSFLPKAFQDINLDYSGLNYRSTEELINCSSCFDKIHYSKKSFSENFEKSDNFFRKLHKNWS